MPTEDDIIRRADEILQRSTGQHPRVRRPAGEEPDKDPLLSREGLSSSYRLGPDSDRNRVPTTPFEQRRIDSILGKIYTARRILRDVLEAIEKSPVPPPPWALRVAELLDEAIKDDRKGT